MPEALTIEKTFPVLGSYQLADATEGQANVNITLDSVNKGMIWVEGLPQGKFKAYLKKSPATYRILAQKTEGGKQIPEGTLILDPLTGALNIALGKDFNDEDPMAIFTTVPENATEVKVKTSKSKTKTKAKLTFYSANKINATTADARAVDSTDQQ